MKVYIIGRDPQIKHGEIPVKVDDPTNTISRTHCRITQIDERTLFIEDAGSKNGTYLGNTKVEKAVSLKPDDLIRLADNINFTVNDVIQGVNLKVKKTDQSEAGQKSDVEHHKKAPEKKMQIRDQKVQPEINSSINKQNKPPSDPIIKGKTPQLDQVIPALKGTVLGSVSSGYLAAVLAFALVTSFSAYFISNLDKSAGGGGFIKDFIAAIKTEKWITYSNSYLKFDYPANWTPTSLGGEVAVARFSDDTLMFTVSIYRCENNNPENDPYSIFRNGINCNMVSLFMESPNNILSIGIQEEMIIRHKLQTVKGHYNWQYLSFSGPALSIGQFLEQMDDNIQKRASELNKEPQNPSKEFIKRYYYVCNAATLSENNTLVCASAYATNADEEIISDYFIGILQSLQLKN